MGKAFLLRWFSRSTLHWGKVDLHFLVLRLRNALLLQRPDRVKPDAQFLNVGCGPCGVPSADWCNVDGWRGPSVDMALDLRRRLPFRDGQFQGIYSEHFVEHLQIDEAARFLRECHRLLRPGGLLRLSVPDGERFLKNYVEDRGWMVAQIDSREWLTATEPSRRTPMAMVNEVFRQDDEHQFCYDFETLSLSLREAGFAEITRAAFGVGAQRELLIDRPTRESDSLYVEARKPCGNPPSCSGVDPIRRSSPEMTE